MELTEEKLAELANWFFDENAAPPAGILNSKVEVALECFDQLFVKAPETSLDSKAIKSFEKIIQDQFQGSPAERIDYHLPYPKYEFLRYLTNNGYLLYGSKNPVMTVLEPREQIDWNGTPLRAVFATRDAFWPMYFALLDRHALSGSLRNGCFMVERSVSEIEYFYFFSVDQESLHANIWSDGMLAVLPEETFHSTTSGDVRFDEWASEEAVPMIATLQVSPEDSPFLHQVTGHDENESIFTTWLKYKERLQAG
jgi:hypothetical protein